MTELGQVPKLEYKEKKITFFSMCAGPAEGMEKPVRTKQKIRRKKTSTSYVTETREANGLKVADVKEVKCHMVRGLRKYWKSLKLFQRTASCCECQES